MSGRTIVVLILALVFGLAAAVMVHVALSPTGSTTVTDEVTVWAAKDQIPAQTQIKQDLFMEMKIPKSVKAKMPDIVVVGSDEAKAIFGAGAKKLTRAVMDKNDFLDARKVADGIGLRGQLDKGFRAFSIPVPDQANVLGGWCSPGDYVDVLLTLKSTQQDDVYATDGGATCSTLLQSVKVLAVGDFIASGPVNEAKDGMKKDTRVRHVTLMVKPEQANQLQLGAAQGELSLALRTADDKEAQAPSPATVSMLRGKTGTSEDMPVYDDRLTELERQFQSRLDEQSRKFEALLGDRTLIEGGGGGGLAERPSYLTIQVFRGQQQSTLKIRMPKKPKETALP